MSRSGYKRMRETDFSNPLGWEERLFFTEMRNRDLAILTEGRFNTENRPFGTHPVFLLGQTQLGIFRFCPCSTKDYNRGKASYILKNTPTTPHNLRVNATSYILHFYTFNLTSDNPLVEGMPLLGQVAEQDIQHDFYKEGAR